MNIAVGNKLKALRKNKNMSQEEVAEYLNISQSTYARIESGISYSWAYHILNICKFFGIVPEELLKINSNTKGIHSVNIIAELSHKVIEQYEQIKELKKVIKDLKEERKL